MEQERLNQVEGIPHDQVGGANYHQRRGGGTETSAPQPPTCGEQDGCAQVEIRLVDPRRYAVAMVEVVRQDEGEVVLDAGQAATAE